jgi:PAS domain S-box-containing protein
MNKKRKKQSDILSKNQLELEDYKGFFETLGKHVIASATDSDGNIIYVNDKFVEVSKYTRDELMGQNHRLLKSGFHDPSFYSDLWKTISSGRVWRGELKNRAKDGTYYWVDTSIAPILNKKGKPEKYVSVRFLISERKRVEDELQKRKEETEFLSGATSLLVSSLDYNIVLKHLAELAIPHIADWCAIDTVEFGDLESRLHRVAVTHADPSKTKLANQLQENYPPNPKSPAGVYRVFETGKVNIILIFHPNISKKSNRRMGIRKLLKILILNLLCVCR